MRFAGLSRIITIKRPLVTERVGNCCNVVSGFVVEDRKSAELEAVLTADSSQIPKVLSESSRPRK